MAVYQRSSNTLQVADIVALLNTPNNVIIADDLNVKHSSRNNRNNNSAGNSLAQYLNSRLDMVVATPTSPTYYPDYQFRSPDIIDIAIMKIDNTAFTIENQSSDISSNHTPIIIDIQTCATQPFLFNPTTRKNWTQF